MWPAFDKPAKKRRATGKRPQAKCEQDGQIECRDVCHCTVRQSKSWKMYTFSARREPHAVRTIWSAQLNTTDNFDFSVFRVAVFSPPSPYHPRHWTALSALPEIAIKWTANRTPCPEIICFRTKFYWKYNKCFSYCQCTRLQHHLPAR